MVTLTHEPYPARRLWSNFHVGDLVHVNEVGRALDVGKGHEIRVLLGRIHDRPGDLFRGLLGFERNFSWGLDNTNANVQEMPPTLSSLCTRLVYTTRRMNRPQVMSDVADRVIP